jgi:hypothetical protein
MASLIQPTPKLPAITNPKDKVVNPVNGETKINEVSVADVMGQNVTNPLMAQQSLYTPGKQTVSTNEIIGSTAGQATDTTLFAPGASTTLASTVAPTTVTPAAQVTAAEGTAATTDAAKGTVTDTIQAQTGTASRGIAAQDDLSGFDKQAFGKVVQDIVLNQIGIPEYSTSYDPVTNRVVTTGMLGQEIGSVSAEEFAQNNNIDLNKFKKPTQIIDPMTGRVVDQKELATAATADRSFLGQFDPAQSTFQSDMQAATMEVTDEMTVQGQLKQLSKQFEDGKVPGWAAGVIRGASQQMAARGLSASSMAGAAITQAALEAALPIATRDAATYYDTAKAIMNNKQQANLTNTQNNLQIEMANLSNRQQVSLAKMQVEASLTGQELSNQQQVNILNANRFAEAANMTFTQEQNRVFANSKMIETLNLQNLSNRQAMALANAANMANMDMANLSNRQQAEVQNAQNLLQMDMANLSNEQQAKTINQAAQQQAMLSNQAAANAAAQFNATSQNQVDQFFANLKTSIDTTNAASKNASAQFNAGQVNAMNQFKLQQKSDIEKFNANNALVIAQSNAQWRRNVNTANTAAQNAANQINAQNYFNLSNTALSNIWQEYRDEASFVYQSSQNNLDRAFNYSMAVLEAETTQEMFDKKVAQSNASSIGSFLATLIHAATSTPSKEDEGDT